MKRNTIAIGCTAAWAAAFVAPPVLAQTTVMVYGTLNADLESVKATGGATQSFSSRTRITSNSSNVGVRGTEELGKGLRAFFQVESAVNIDNGTASGFWASRNSAIGLIGGFGQFLIGQWDSPYKFSTLRFDPTGDTGIAAYSAIIGGTGSITAGQGGTNFRERASFDRRVSNVIQWWSPNWSGATVRLAYGAPDTEAGSAATGVPESANRRPSLYAGMVNWEAGPWYAVLTTEYHKDFQALNVLVNPTTTVFSRSRDYGWKGGVMYSMDTTWGVGAIVERLKYHSDQVTAAGGLDRRVTNWYIVGRYGVGPHNIALWFGYKGEEHLEGGGVTVDGSNSKAKQISARYGYMLSRRTQLYAIATRISNDSNAFQQFGNSPITNTTLFLDPARGADPSGVGVGAIHAF